MYDLLFSMIVLVWPDSESCNYSDVIVSLLMFTLSMFHLWWKLWEQRVMEACDLGISSQVLEVLFGFVYFL